MSTNTHEIGKIELGATAEAKNSSVSDTNVQMTKELSDFCIAAAGKKPDEICTAYQVLRDSANGVTIGQLLCRVGQTLGHDPAGLIISAYSHRHCFMCNGGTIACDHCKGRGEVAAGRPCPRCDGIGLTTCGFCGGTGWGDRGIMPPEIASAALSHQLARTRSDLKHLAQTAAQLTVEKISLLEADQRKLLGAWMVRLQARLLDLAQTDAVDDAEGTYLETVAAKIGACLDILRRTG